MATKETNEKRAPRFDAAKSSKVADELSVLITGLVARSRPKSIAEGLLMMTLAMGRVIQVLSTVMGCDAKVVGRDFCNSLAKYFEMGGDGRIDDIAASLRQKGN